MFSWLPILAFFSLVILAVVVLLLKLRNPIEDAGFHPGESPGPLTLETVDRLLGRDVERALRGPQDAWLLGLESAGGDAPALYALVYRLRRSEAQEVALIRSSDDLAWSARKAKGGVYARLVPLEGAAQDPFAQTDWVLLGNDGTPPNDPLLRKLSQAVLLPDAQFLLGIAIRDADLVVWSDAKLHKKLLVAGPAIHSALDSAA